MPDSYKDKKYTDIVLDFSVLFAPLPGTLRTLLSSRVRLWTAASFSVQHKHMIHAVPQRLQKVYQQNLQLLEEFSSLNTYNPRFPDTLSVVWDLCRKKKAVLLVSANRLLNMTVFAQIKSADLWNLFSNRIIPADQFSYCIQRFEPSGSSTHYKYTELCEGSTVYAFQHSSCKGKYTLAEEQSTGAESSIFRVKEAPGLLAKIYAPDFSVAQNPVNFNIDDENLVSQLTCEKLAHLHNMMEMPTDVDWAALPHYILCADSSGNIPVGYAMPYFQNVHFMTRDSIEPQLFIPGGGVEAKVEDFPHVTVDNVLEFSIRLVRQIMFLACNGVYLTDYNTNNFTIPDSNEPIRMVDVDSFTFGSYLSDCKSYSPSAKSEFRLSRDYDLANPGELADFCVESLSAFILSLLILDPGFLPFLKDQFSMSANMRKNNPACQRQWNFVPQPLQKYFLQVFEQGRQPSVGALLLALEQSRSEPTAQRTYAEIYTSPGRAEPKSKMQSKSTDRFNRLRNVAYALFILVVFVSSIFLWPIDISTIDGNPLFGSVSMAYKNGDVYDGEVIFLFPWGEGTKTCAEGGSYDGQWKFGRGHGQGVYTYADGDIYSGQWKDGVRHGQGVCIYANGCIYEGEWEDNLQHGHGIYTWSSGDRYEGQWENGVRHGQGVYIWPSGDRFEGFYLDGENSEEGIFYFADGGTEKGRIVNAAYEPCN